MPWSGNLLKHPCLEVDARLKGLYHTSVGMLRGLLKLQNHWMVYLPQVQPIPRRIGISPTNGHQSIRMRFMPWSGNLLKHPYLDDFSEPCCLEVDASLKGLYHTSVGMLRGLLKLQNHWIVYLPHVLPSPRRTGMNITDQWTPEYQDVFDALKWKLVETPTPGRLQWAMLPRSWRKFERIMSYLRRYVKGFATIEWPTWMTSLYILGRLQWTMLPRSWRKF